MKSIGLEIRHSSATIPALHAGICDSPAIEREIVVGGHAHDGVETVTSFVDGERDAYESLLEGRETVLEYETTPADDGFFLYLRRELESRGASMLDALAAETLVIVPPIELRSDRTMRTTVVGHPNALAALFEGTPDGMALDVRWVSDDVRVTAPTVSERQREALRVAREVGFYEIPRENGIEAVAAELDCAVSTASELLRRGEANAVERALEDGP
ncbi:helix-turn-helix domain-containing protein [Natronolimnohabitans innermongolicus]|uniref:Bacterio-opsin activator HTH domain-containing protein n=1 Tax=Natronolimnohabitans innermongolicus JCM 12255 TaxID=1227499 RepID=L9WKT6_9EURY|nr:helix-turn-helix domain-containing protein [Natronolimnohabitans innermongolicus]ELY50059.1 bacterio-opsin activator HTH domain-containing protein [Natronolimnohabitans innermongolicus JCM 12255]